MRTHPFFGLWFCILSALALLQASKTEAQVIVYRLSFEPAGEAINYAPYQSGFYVAPINGGVGSLILTRTNSGKKYYVFSNFGEIFIALKNKTRKAVISATAANSLSTTTFFAIGDADEKMDVATRTSDVALVAKELKGYAVSADSERDLPFSSNNATDIGVAGASLLTCKLDQGLTDGAIALNRTLNDEVNELTLQLGKQGYTNGDQQNPGGGDGGFSPISPAPFIPSGTPSGNNSTISTSGLSFDP
jgi:hypothetical protein